MPSISIVVDFQDCHQNSLEHAKSHNRGALSRLLSTQLSELLQEFFETPRDAYINRGVFDFCHIMSRL
jgi:hypothetical protein